MIAPLPEALPPLGPVTSRAKAGAVLRTLAKLDDVIANPTIQAVKIRFIVNSTFSVIEQIEQLDMK
jgi:hypothetical protein